MIYANFTTLPCRAQYINMKGTYHVWGWILTAVAVTGLLIGLIYWLTSPSVLPTTVENPFPLIADSVQHLDEDWAPALSPDSSVAFNLQTSIDPPNSAKPWVVWSWNPLATQTKDIYLTLSAFKQKKFGGVILKPSTQPIKNQTGLGLTEQLPIIFSFAEKLGLKLDLHLFPRLLAGISRQPKDPLTHLVFGEAHIKGNKWIDISLPEPEIPAIYSLGQQHVEIPVLAYQPDRKKLLHLIAAKPALERRSYATTDLTDQTILSKDSVFLLDPYVNDSLGRLQWYALPGDWLLIAIYELPVGAFTQPLEVTPHLESQNWFEDSTVLSMVHQGIIHWLISTYAQQPAALRGIQIGPWAVPAETFYYEGVLTDIRENCGYNFLPFLPAVLVPGQNNPWYDELNWDRKSPFSYDQHDQKYRYDYQKAINHQFLRQGIQPLMSQLDRLHVDFTLHPPRWDTDLLPLGQVVNHLITHPTIGSNSSLGNKMTISANWLAGHQLNTAQIDLQTPKGQVPYSPQLLRLQLDYLYGLGINQVQFTQFPSIRPEKNKGPNTSSLLLQSWQELAGYVNRTQYALQQGKPVVEIGIYYPFDGFPSNWAYENSHQEWLFQGEVKGLTAPQHNQYASFVQTSFASQLQDERIQWLHKIWPFIQILENKGLSWTWVNDQALQSANYQPDKQHIRFQSLPCQILFCHQVERLSIESAQTLEHLSKQGANVIWTGPKAMDIPGFTTIEDISEILLEALVNIPYQFPTLTQDEFEHLLENLSPHQQVSYHRPYAFLRRMGRKLGSNEELHFFHNIYAKDRIFRLDLAPQLTYAYWIDLKTGTISKAQRFAPHTIEGFLPSYESRLLWVRVDSLALRESNIPPIALAKTNPFTLTYIRKRQLKDWTWILRRQVSNRLITLEDTSLFSWWKLGKDWGIPTEVQTVTSFELADTSHQLAYILDLGILAGSAEIRLNTKRIAQLYQAPYRVDISKEVEPGLNILEIWVKRPRLPDNWQELAPSDRPIIGMPGPVWLWEVLKQDANLNASYFNQHESRSN